MKRALLATGILLSLLVVHAQAQVAATAEVGANPFKSYSGGDIDHIQLQNGKLYLSIPLVSYPQLGKLSLSFSLLANSSSWVPVASCDVSGDCDYSYGATDLCSYQTYAGEPVSDSFGGGPSTVQLVMDQQLNYCENLSYIGVGELMPACDMWGCTSPGPADYYIFPAFSVYDSSNATHPMGFTGPNSTDMYATDGSGLKLSMPTFYSSYSPYYPYTITDPSGVAQIFTSSTEVIKDPNGNSINIDSNNNIIDSAGRPIPSIYALQPADISQCPAFGGPPADSAGSWIVPGPNGSSATYLFCNAPIPISTNFFGLHGGSENSGCESDGSSPYAPCNYITWDESSYSADLLQSVVLPDGTFWGFGYDTTTSSQDTYGDLTEVHLPSGGVLKYTYNMIVLCGAPDADNDLPYSRAVVTREAQPIVGDDVITNYSYGPTQTIETDANGNQTVHNFTFDYQINYGSQCGAEETSTKWYQGAASTSTPLREVDTAYQMALDPQQIMVTFGPPMTQETDPSLCCGKTDKLPSTITTLQNGQLTGIVTNTYDFLFTDVEPYFWESMGDDGSGQLMSPLTSQIYYAKPALVNDGIKSTMTSRWADIDLSAQAANMVDLPYISAICNSTNYASCLSQAQSGQAPATTTYSYDGAGNATSIARMISPSQSAITTQTFTNHGMPETVTDPLGNSGVPNHTTTYAYDPTGLYVTSRTQPSTNGVPHVNYYSQDFNTGLLTIATDQNASSVSDTAHSTRYTFNNGNRLTRVDYPDGGWLTQCYTDEGEDGCSKTAPPYSMVSQRAQNSTVTEQSSVLFDGLGRPVQSTDPAGATTETTYDANGHVASVSNPHYGSILSTDGTTSYSYDPLGRKTSQTDADGVSTQYWSYSGSNWESTTTYQDENGNQWQRTSDTLGRLATVLEPSGSSQAPSIKTDYTYDPLNNLSQVNQWGDGTSSMRARSFSYDGLSRLLTATNPETGTVNYTYDVNGNVQTKTDARGVVTYYAYDELNRLLSKTYSDGETPSSCYQYDQAGIGFLANAWTQSASAGPCSMSTAYYAKRSILQYDPMGRIRNEQQYTPASQAIGTYYAPAYTYDSAGHLLTSTSGVGSTPAASPITFTNTYDGAGRLQMLTSNWVDSTHPMALFSAQPGQTVPCPNSSSSPYDPFGNLTNAKFGNGLTLNRVYDRRSRMNCEIDMGSGAATSGSATITISGEEQNQ